MSRSRIIKPEFASDEKLARVSRDSRLTYILMWTCCDDYGVTKGNAAWLKSQIFPYDDLPLKRFEGWIKELADLRRIIPFSVSGEHYYFIPGFEKHQKVDHPSKNRNPEAPRDILANVSREFRDETETETEYKQKLNIGGADAPKLLHLRYVYLTEKEHEAMEAKIGKEATAGYIERLDGYIGQIGAGTAGKKYKSHYDTMMNWYRKDVADGKATGPPKTDTDDPIKKILRGERVRNPRTGEII